MQPRHKSYEILNPLTNSGDTTSARNTTVVLGTLDTSLLAFPTRPYKTYDFNPRWHHLQTQLGQSPPVSTTTSRGFHHPANTAQLTSVCLLSRSLPSLHASRHTKVSAARTASRLMIRKQPGGQPGCAFKGSSGAAHCEGTTPSWIYHTSTLFSASSIHLSTMLWPIFGTCSTGRCEQASAYRHSTFTLSLQ